MKKLILSLIGLLICAAVGISACFAAYCLRRSEEEHQRQEVFIRMQADWISYLGEYDSELLSFKNENHIGIGKGSKTKCMTFYTEDDVSQWQFQYSDLNTYTMYNTLSDREKVIYKALEYAAENFCNYVFIEKDLADGGKNLSKILIYVTLDSPIIEQSLYFRTGESYSKITHIDVTRETEKFGTFSVEEAGYLFNITSFSTKSPEMRDAYLEAAENIVAGIPDGSDELGRAEYLYRWLCQNTTYERYSEHQYTYEQVYDALITGKTVCDGFANATSLLFNMAGIPCFEKEYFPLTDDADDEGHTWACFYANGAWYNADATFDEGLDADSDRFLRGFAFSDKFEWLPHEYDGIIPKCTSDTLFDSYQVFDPEDTENAYDRLSESYREHDKRFGFIVFTEHSDSEKVISATDKITNMIKYSTSGDITGYFYTQLTDIVDGSVFVLYTK